MYCFFLAILFSKDVLDIHYVYADVFVTNPVIFNKRLVNELSMWLEANYEFKKEQVIKPAIKVVSGNALCETAFKESDIVKENISCEKIMGLYNYNEKVIYINELVDLNKKAGEAIVLHELVHHYQFESGLSKNISSLADLEKLAIAMEEKYLSENN